MDKKQTKVIKPGFLPAKKLATNRDFSLVINDFGDLYAWGNNRDERLGLKNESSEFIENPRKYDFFVNKYMRMVEVSCGNYHIAVVAKNKDGSSDNEGYVFTWGLDLFGRLGYISDFRKNDKEIHDQDTYVFRTTPVMLKIQDKVARVACGTDFTACLTIKGQIYTWGTNKWGNLGVENMNYTSEQYVVRQPTLVETLAGKYIIQIACGSKHMLALSQERRVYSWGSGDYGVLGLNSEIGYNTPQLIKDIANEEVISICCGDFNSGAINTNGHLYLWGNGKFGRLGVGSEDNYNYPKKVEDMIMNDKVFYCSIGFYHTIITCIEGKTYAWGYSENGRLGCIEKVECDQKKKFLTPRLVYPLNNVKISQVYAGHHHSLAITLGGKILGWGENVHKVMGDIKNDEDKKKGITKKTVIYFPEELPVNKALVRVSGGIQDLWSTYFLSTSSMSEAVKGTKRFKIFKIACGGTHTLALTESGDILSWGYGNYGQLGLGSEKKSVVIPTLINFETDRKFLKIYAGNTHSMAISKDVFEVYTWGDGSKGQLGIKGDSSAEPIIVEDLIGKDIVKGACGYDFTGCITIEGKLYMFGSNVNFKLGIESINLIEKYPKSVDTLVGVKKVSLGLHHAAAINSNGDLFTWGHGFFGQLGHGDNVTLKVPKKVEMGELKIEKIKCGTYYTLVVDKREMPYIWGKSLLNLSLDKNKNRPELIEDFKTAKVLNIQVGYGNSLVLSKENDVFGFGDNEFYKAGADIQLEKFVTKNPKFIKFGNDPRSKTAIDKIFCGYHSCFAISNTGDIYAWGNPRNNRLTKDFEDKVEKKPKLISIVWKNDSKVKEVNEEIDENDDSKKKLEEKDIMLLLNNKLRLLEFDELFRIIESLDTKYDDDEIDKKDDEFKLRMDEMIKCFPEIMRDFNITDPYMTVMKLLTTRWNSMMIPRKISDKEIKTKIPDPILSYLFEIEKVFSLLFMHPCYFYEIIEVLKIEEYETFINGIKPLYCDLEMPYFSSFVKNETLDNMQLIALFRLLLVHDFFQFKNDIELLFTKQKSFSELILEMYFFNKFKRSVLLDIFEKSLTDIKALSESTLKKTNITILNSLKALLTENIQGLGEKEIFKKEHVDELINLVKSIMIEIENNISKIPPYVAYCLRFSKRKIKKYLKEQGSYATDKDKLKVALLRLLFKNVISKLFKRLSSDNHEYLTQIFNYGGDSEIRKNIENYLPIIGEFLDRIASNSPINSDFINNQNGEIDNKNIEDSIGIINTVITSSFLKLFDIFNNKILKNDFQFKKEIINSVLMNNLDSKIKRLYVDLKTLIDFLKILNKKRGKGFFANLKILDLFETSGAIKPIYANFDPNYKILMYINTKFMTEGIPFIEKYAKELRLEDDVLEVNFIRCKNCHSILPHFFVNQKDRTEFLIKPFKDKVKEKYLSVFSKVVKHPNFVNKSGIGSMKELYDRLKELIELLIKEKIAGLDDVQTVLRELEDVLNDNRKDDEKMQEFITFLHQHIKKKIKHYNLMRTSDNILFDIDNQKATFIRKLESVTDDLVNSKDTLKSMKNSLDILENKDKKELELTHVIKHFVQYNDDNIFRYKLHEESLSSLLKKRILLSFENSEWDLSDIVLQLSANNNKKFFDLKLSLKRTKELIKSYSFTYNDYLYYSVNSNTFSVLNFGEFGNYNCSLFLELIHQQIIDK